MNAILWFNEIREEHAAAVGGKGLNLGLMTAAELPVPPGFVIVAEAYRECRLSLRERKNAATFAERKATLHSQILAAYDRLGGAVAVRSSATCEDGAEHSFAGQQETILGVVGHEALIDAVERCWKSLDTERSLAYRQANRIDETNIAMAVVVQRLVPADVAGVLFTRDPHDASGHTLLIEAAPGLGEAVVSGRVMPDRFQVDRETGAVVQQQIHAQRERLDEHGWQPIAAQEQHKPSLSPAQLVELAKVSARIEAYYGAPRDVEWALVQNPLPVGEGGRGTRPGEGLASPNAPSIPKAIHPHPSPLPKGEGTGAFFVLQARPITTGGAAELAALRQVEIAKLKALTAPGGTIWARYNLAEVLPAPTPLTWSIVKRFMSGRGGYGLMFRDLGYDPDPALDDAGFIDLICGRPYVNLCREPKLFFRDFPYGYDFEAIRAEPSKAIYPRLTTVRARMTGRFWWRLPWIVRSMLVSSSRTQALLKSEAERLEREVYPQFVASVRDARANTKLTDLANDDLLAFLHRWIDRTLNDFARHSLRAGVLAATALAALEQQLTLAKVDESRAAALQLVMGVRPKVDSDLAGAVASLVDTSPTQFLAMFGHRGPREMELAEPRWSETPERLPRSTKSPLDSRPAYIGEGISFARKATLQDFTTPTPALLIVLEQARTYLALRESSKHYLMLGYALIREAIVEIGRRTKLADRVFYLTLEELPQALRESFEKNKDSGGAAPRQKAGEALAIASATLASERMKKRKLLLSLPVPPVIFSEDLEAIGRAPVHSGTRAWQGTALSFGVCEGPALVLTEPIPVDDIAEGFVLVCPSTDPAWVPLFMKAGGLVMETGGVLSHGAIVAREFGIPAVAGISGATAEIQTGQRVSVDGTTGRVSVVE